MLHAAAGVPAFAVQDAAACCAGFVTCTCICANLISVCKLPGVVVKATLVRASMP